MTYGSPLSPEGRHRDPEGRRAPWWHRFYVGPTPQHSPYHGTPVAQILANVHRNLRARGVAPAIPLEATA